MFLKIAPDLDEAQVGVIAHTLQRQHIDGVIATNTTLSRHSVEHHRHADQQGGLSGAPVFDLSNIVIRALRKEVGDAVPIIGVGGILSGDDARAKIQAGAQLVQLYSGLIYRGPALVKECADALKDLRTQSPVHAAEF
jgi:dihydroorotate dehydrogenase